jgi:hypothetical protein
MKISYIYKKEGRLIGLSFKIHYLRKDRKTNRNYGKTRKKR